MEWRWEEVELELVQRVDEDPTRCSCSWYRGLGQEAQRGRRWRNGPWYYGHAHITVLE